MTIKNKVRKDRDPIFRQELFTKNNNQCCGIETTTGERCKNLSTDIKLKIFRKDGNINNNTSDNLLILCPYHYGVEYYKKTKAKKKEAKGRGIRTEKKQLELLTIEDYRCIVSIITDQDHRMMFQTLYYFGLRVNELINITPDDFKIKEKIIIVRAETAKRKKQRRVDIPEVLISPYEKYLKGKDKETKLFNITKQRVWQLVKEYTSLANIKKNIHPHTFRHSYATEVYNKTGDLKLVQELLGHENMSTTSIYAHLSPEYRKKKINEVFGR